MPPWIGGRIDAERINFVDLGVHVADQREEGVDDRVEQAMRYPVGTMILLSEGDDPIEHAFRVFRDILEMELRNTYQQDW
jgi:hypothetical protein